jgi:hypothetical protein
MVNDQYKCYDAPYGAVGLISDLISIYMIVCLLVGRTPLYPKRSFRPGNTDFFGLLCFFWITVPFVINLVNAIRCLGAGRWPLGLIAVGKSVLGLIWGWFVLVTAPDPTQTMQSSGNADAGGSSDINTEDASVGTAGVGREEVTTGNPSYREAAVQVGDGWAQMVGEYLPSYSVVDPSIMLYDLSRADSQPSPSASDIESACHPTISMDIGHEDLDAESPMIKAPVRLKRSRPTICCRRQTLLIPLQRSAQRPLRLWLNMISSHKRRQTAKPASLYCLNLQSQAANSILSTGSSLLHLIYLLHRLS